jgi:8-oxo-dGTP pyrophosphatase MutT (NUDIX family)
MSHVSKIVFLDYNNRVLIGLRNKNAHLYPNMWGLFGGRSNKGETPDQTIKRELDEEINYVPTRVEPLIVLEEHNGPHHYFISRYRGPAQIVTTEEREARFVTIDEARTLQLTPPTRRVFELLLQNPGWLSKAK